MFRRKKVESVTPDTAIVFDPKDERAKHNWCIWLDDEWATITRWETPHPNVRVPFMYFYSPEGKNRAIRELDALCYELNKLGGRQMLDRVLPPAVQWEDDHD